MTSPVDIAVVGATGLVGELLVELLEERDFPVGTLHVLGAGEAVGHALPFKGRNLRVRDAATFDFAQVRLVFLAGEGGHVEGLDERLNAAGCDVIDLVGALPPATLTWMVAEASGDRLAGAVAPFRVGNPCSPTILLASVLAPLRTVLALRRITVTACLAVSSRGREGVGELARQSAELLNARPLEPRVFEGQMAFNLLGVVEDRDAEGHGRLERRVHDELRDVLGLPALEVAATCIQAPVFFGDSLSVSVLAEQPVDLPRLRELLAGAAGLEVAGDDECPSVVDDAVGQDVVHVGRLRLGLHDPRELNLWIASDNVRKGAALNAVQSAELLIKHYL